jgi:hypothetical protein
LHKVCQGKGTAAQYRLRFEQYKNKCGYNNGTLHKFYYAGLNESFKQRLTNSTADTITLPQCSKDSALNTNKHKDKRVTLTQE